MQRREGHIKVKWEEKTNEERKKDEKSISGLREQKRMRTGEDGERQELPLVMQCAPCS